MISRIAGEIGQRWETAESTRALAVNVNASPCSRTTASSSCLVGLVVSGLVYLVASRSLDLAPERAAIEASDRELQSITGSPTSA